MDLEPTSPIDEAGEGKPVHFERPRASAWLWRPCYAKLWWGASVLYWIGKLGSFWRPSVDAFYTSPLAGYFNVLLYPLTVLMVLGVGYAGAWMDCMGVEWAPPTHDQLFPKRSIGGYRDPAADPLDPRSGLLHWRHFHPDN